MRWAYSGPPIYWRGTTIEQTWWRRWLLKLAIPARVRQAWREEAAAQTPGRVAEPELTAEQIIERKRVTEIYQRMHTTLTASGPTIPTRPLDFNPRLSVGVIRPACHKVKP